MQFYIDAKHFFEFYMNYIEFGKPFGINEDREYLKLIQIYSVAYLQAFMIDNSIAESLPEQNFLDKATNKEVVLFIYDAICKALENSNPQV